MSSSHISSIPTTSPPGRATRGRGGGSSRGPTANALPPSAPMSTRASSDCSRARRTRSCRKCCGFSRSGCITSSSIRSFCSPTSCTLLRRIPWRPSMRVSGGRRAPRARPDLSPCRPASIASVSRALDTVSITRVRRMQSYSSRPPSIRLSSRTRNGSISWPTAAMRSHHYGSPTAGQ